MRGLLRRKMRLGWSMAWIVAMLVLDWNAAKAEVKKWPPPQTIISEPVQTAVCLERAVGTEESGAAVQVLPEGW